MRAKCPQCPIPGLPLSHNAAGHFYAHFYIYLLVCRVHDVFPVFVGEEDVESAIDWNKVQVSVKLELKSLPKGIQADLKMEKFRDCYLSFLSRSKLTSINRCLVPQGTADELM